MNDLAVPPHSIEAEQAVIGALLLHSPVEGMNEAVSQGFGVLAISISVALVLSILLSIQFCIQWAYP